MRIEFTNHVQVIIPKGSILECEGSLAEKLKRIPSCKEIGGTNGRQPPESATRPAASIGVTKRRGRPPKVRTE